MMTPTCRALVLLLMGVCLIGVVRRAVVARPGPRRTLAQRLQEHGVAARGRLQPRFQRVGMHYPPRRITLLALKDEARLELYASPGEEPIRFVTAYPILRLSGGPGPKLREGDRQVPEGRYRVTFLNPNSRYHLSLRLDYPNEFDRRMAKKDLRLNLGGDIMIHGGSASIGCLAMGDPAIEELFVLAADTGISQTSVVIAPVDFRRRGDWQPPSTVPSWTRDLYAGLREELAALRAAPAE